MLAVALAGGIGSTTQSQLAMYQLDLFTDSGSQVRSNWGSCELTFVWQQIPLYFNLKVDHIWGVQNVAVFSGRPPGQVEKLRFNFPLPIEPGTPYPMGLVAYSLTPQPVGPPIDAVPLPFLPTTYEIYSGVVGGRMEIGPPEPLIGCLIQDAPAAHKDFPNQDCGPLECIPAAVSNSLKFLNAKHKMGMEDGKLGIDKMKVATGWRRDIGADNEKWSSMKDRYCKLTTKGGAPQIPVTTRRLDNSRMGEVEAEIRANQDVEIGTDTHCMAVVGIAECADGYTVQVAHDTDQKKVGGTVTETGTVGKNSRKIKGIPFVNNQVVRYIVVECPKR